MNKGNHLLSTMSMGLSTLAMLHPSAKAIRRETFKSLCELNDELVKYLHGENPAPDWAQYPLARDWFTQQTRKWN